MISHGTRLYIPLSRQALQSLNLYHDIINKLKLINILDTWLRIAQSLRLLPYLSSNS